MSPAETFGRMALPGFQDTQAPQRAPCACGTDVTRAPYESIAAAVRRHNRSAGHARWWVRVRATWQ